MAFFAGIGRALTSIGSDMQRNRLERDQREQFFADRRDQRDYAEDIRDQQAGIRAAETKANRDWSRRQQVAQNLYTEGVTQVDRDWTVTEFDRQAGVRADAAEAAARLADARQQEGWTRTDEQWTDATAAAERLSRSGQPHPSVVALPGTTYDAYGGGPDRGSPAEDWMTMQRVGARPMTPSPSIDPSTAVWQAFQDEQTLGGFDEAGRPIGPRGDVTEAWQRGRALVNQRQYVPPPQTTAISGLNATFAPPPISGGLGRDAGSGRQQQSYQVGPTPGAVTDINIGQTIMTDEEFEELRASGRYSDDELSRIWTNSTAGSLRSRPGVR